jgi:hypothetical protein
MVHSRLGSGLRKVERAGLLLVLKKCCERIFDSVRFFFKCIIWTLN